MGNLYLKSAFLGMRKIVLLPALVTVIISLLNSCNKLPFNNQFSEVVYVETNTYMKDQNAIIAYRNNGDGKLLEILGGPFFTGGSGVGNPQQLTGPNESDNEISISNDKKFLLAVNSGSNTIAVFKINIDGTLSPVPGSPFNSFGETPVSIDIKGPLVYVANKSDNPINPPSTPGNFTVFKLEGDGSLTHLDSSTASNLTTVGSPAAVLAVRDYPFVFAPQFFGVKTNSVHAGLYIYHRDSVGRIIPKTNVYLINVRGGAPLGLWQHPVNSNIVYIGCPAAGQVAIANMSLNSTTKDLHLDWTDVNVGPAAGTMRTNNAGNRMYALSSGDNSVSVFNTSSPTAPVLLQKLALKNAGPAYIHSYYQSSFTSSECYSLGLSSNEKFLYVVSQHTNPDFSIGNYNYLHVLSVNSNGTLSEPDDPMQLPVPNNVRPRGVAVYQIN